MKSCGASNSLIALAAASAASMLAVMMVLAGGSLLPHHRAVAFAADIPPNSAVPNSTLWKVAADSAPKGIPLPPVASPIPTPESNPTPATTTSPPPAAGLSATLSRTKTVMVPQSSEAPDDTAGSGTPLTTTEIPQAMPTNQAEDDGAPNAPVANPGAHANLPVDYDNGNIRYDGVQVPDEGMAGMQDFMDQDDLASPLGMEVREDRRKVDSGEEAEGLLIVGILPNSPAAHAGLHAYSRKVRDALETAAVGAAMVFPPAVLLMPVLDQVPLGEGYDLIIAVDGTRVTNFLDFEDRLRDVQPGEIVYLGIVRDGRRLQIPVKVSSPLPGALF